MNACCPHCSLNATLDLSRAPAASSVSVTCPRCKNPFTVETPTPAPAAAPVASTDAAGAPGAPGVSSARGTVLSERDFETLVREVEHEVTRRVLRSLGSRADGGPAGAPETRLSADADAVSIVAGAGLSCGADAALADDACRAMEEMGMVPERAVDVAAASGLVVQRDYGVVLVAEAMEDDPQGGLKVVDRLSRLPGSKRRRTIVAYVSPNVRTGDAPTAFILGVNVTVNREDAPRLAEILRAAVTDHDKLYRPYLEVLEAVR